MLSIIVPAYNAERTLKKSIENLLGKESLEIIIVENGSTDSTTAVAEEIATSSTNVHVIHSKKGVSNARNLGIDYANGDYIAFLDADDNYEDEALLKLYEKAKNNELDIVMGAYSRDYLNTNEEYFYLNNEENFEEENKVSFIKDTLIPEKGVGFVWGKIIRTSLLKSNKLYFNAELSFAEDAEMMFRVAMHAKKINYTPVILYHYWFNPSSAVRKYKPDLDKLYLKSMEAILEDMRETDTTDQFKNEFSTFVNNHLLIIAVNYSFSPYNGKSYSENKKAFKELCKNDVFNDALKHPNYRSLSMTRAIPLFFAKHHMYFLLNLVVLFRHKQFKKRSEVND